MKKILLFLSILLFFFSCGQNISTTSNTKDSSSSMSIKKELETDTSLSPKSGKYNFVIYKDRTGLFIAPNGGIICSIGVSGGKKETLYIFLRKKIQILGHDTDDLYVSVSRDRLFADYIDLFEYDKDYHPNKMLGVPIESIKDDEKEIFYFDLDSSQIEQMDIKPLNLSFGDEYTLIVLNDKSAVLYDAFGKHICNIDYNENADDKRIDLYIPHNITMFGNVRTDELIIYKSKLYTSTSDYVNVKYSYYSNSKTDNRCAEVQQREEGDVIIYTFPTTALPPKPLE